MALIFRIDRKHYATSGLVPLKRGDDWKLIAKMLETYARYSAELDLTNATATAFFGADPAANLPGNVLTVPVVVSNPEAGEIQIDVPASGTPSAGVAQGVGMYCTVQHPVRGLVTVPLENPDLDIEDRSFDQS